MKHDWNTWLKNRVLREARAHRNFKFEFEEEELQVGPHIVDVKFIIEADFSEEEPMVKYGDSPYPGSPAHWEWHIKKILEVHPSATPAFHDKRIATVIGKRRTSGLNIPENEIIDSLMKRLDDANMQERLSDEAEKRSPGRIGI
jgi:hypothetical protein